MPASNNVVIDREGLHRELDEWLDAVALRPLNVQDGESHTFTIEGGGGAGTGRDDEDLTSFVVTRSSTRML